MIEAASYFPERIMTNHDIEKLVETSDAWITSRTGIKTRHVAAHGETTSDLAVNAIQKLLKKIDKSADEIDFLIVATVTPDMLFPNTACVVQKKIGAKKAWCVDISAACSGFLYSLSIADQFIKTGKYKNAIVVGSEVMSSILDYTDRTTCVLFGDGAAAVYLEGSDDATNGIIDTSLYADGTGGDFLYMRAGGSLHPATHETVDKKEHYVRQDGQSVFKVAVTKMADITEEILKKNNLTGKELDFFVPHQANLRIIEACAKRIELAPEKVVINIDRYGNTTAATIPSCLADLRDQKKLKSGDLVVMSAFGAGFTYGAALVRWG